MQPGCCNNPYTLQRFSRVIIPRRYTRKSSVFYGLTDYQEEDVYYMLLLLELNATPINPSHRPALRRMLSYCFNLRPPPSVITPTVL